MADLERIHLRTGAQLVRIPAFRTDGKPGALFVTEACKITGGLFSAAPRVYWIINDSDSDSIRGGHGHPEGGKLEYLVCLHGHVEAELHSDEECETLILEGSTTALVIPTGIWHRFRLSPGAILLSVASTEFSSDEAFTEMPCACGPLL